MARTTSAGGRPIPVVRPPDAAKYAERTATGWQWANGAGVTYRLEFHRKRVVWIAHADRPGSMPRHADRPDPTSAMLAGAWPIEARATFRRTLRPLGLVR